MTDNRSQKMYARTKKIMEFPNFIEIQLDSFQRLKDEFVPLVMKEFSPIELPDHSLQIYFPDDSEISKQYGLKYWFTSPEHSMYECMDKDITYGCPLYASVLLTGSRVSSPVKSNLFLCNFPQMTPSGSFIINGSERVVISQLVKSPGVYYHTELDPGTGNNLAVAKLIPDQGAYIELITKNTNELILRYDKRKAMPATLFLRALAAVNDGMANQPLVTGTSEELYSLFSEQDKNIEHQYITSTIEKEPDLHKEYPGMTPCEAAVVWFFQMMKPTNPPRLDDAVSFLENRITDIMAYDLGFVGRYKLNQQLGLKGIIPEDCRGLTKMDLVQMVRKLIDINNAGVPMKDDIDHMANRRIRTVGELVMNDLRNKGFKPMRSMAIQRMQLYTDGPLNPEVFLNVKPIDAALRSFFGMSQMSQFMDQNNPLAELRHKRTISALGPGGLKAKRADFDVRDIHHTHYGRLCPVETPEGPNTGLVGRLSTYGKVNRYGFIETPYRKVYHSLPVNDRRLIGRMLAEDVYDRDGDIIAEKGTRLSASGFSYLKNTDLTEIHVAPFVTDEIVYMDAAEEDAWTIAQPTALLNEYNEFTERMTNSRHYPEFLTAAPEQIDYMDISPQQAVGMSASLIPFLQNDDGHRSLMGTNMMAQAVPLLNPEIPFVCTGMEKYTALDSSRVLLSQEDGEVVTANGSNITLRGKSGNLSRYNLRKYQRSNQATCINQKPAVVTGQQVKKNDVLADGTATVDGWLALGHNPVIAFLSWEGGNYEDAVLISENLIKDDKFTSVDIEVYEAQAHRMKAGPEEITRDLPEVNEKNKRDLDSRGIVRVGTEVEGGDILVGKLTPKAVEEENTNPTESILRAIFGKDAIKVKDTSLRMPWRRKGRVIDVKVFTSEDTPSLEDDVDMVVRVTIAHKRPIVVGDKMSGRHGNKGVVSRVLPAEDMPFMDDGTPIDILLNPLGVPARMNVGQLLEVHLGWAMYRMGIRAISPVFDSATYHEIEAELARAWMFDEAWNDMEAAAWEYWNSPMEYCKKVFADRCGLSDEETKEVIDSLISHGYVKKSERKNENDIFYEYISVKNNLPDENGIRGQQISPEEIAGMEDRKRRELICYQWVREYGYDPDDIFDWKDVPENAPELLPKDVNAILASLKIWLIRNGQQPEGDTEDILRKQASDLSLKLGKPYPLLGKKILTNGKTGEKFDHPVTVGIMTMIKLHHLVDDKVHARSTGTYSMITQQPLSGKANNGGQRIGEMEVWALQSYGCAYLLQEMMTIKSDDVIGRAKAYEAMVTGQKFPEPGIPSSFRVLVHELQGLGLSVYAYLEDNRVLMFGKKDFYLNFHDIPGGAAESVNGEESDDVIDIENDDQKKNRPADSD